MTKSKLSGAFVTLATNTNAAEKAAKPMFFVTAAVPDGAYRNLKIFDKELPAMPNRLCWLTAEKISTREWILTRHHCAMTSVETVPDTEQYILDSGRISNGEMVRALSGWIRLQKHAPINGLSESLYPDAKKVGIMPNKAYGKKTYQHYPQ